MQLKRLTRSGVLAALTECDRIGREKFLADNGFDTARQYFLISDGRIYDSRAIAGVAYRFDTGEVVRSGDFTGGTAVADTLTQLGFRVTSDAKWTWPELVLACDILHTAGWMSTIRSTDPRVQDLSLFLRSLGGDAALSAGYRSADSVQFKLENLRTVHPDYTGKPTRGGKLDRLVVQAYLTAPEAMHEAALQIRSDAALVPMSGPESGDYP